MPKFKYFAVDATGKTIEGIQEANDAATVISFLKSNKAFPTDVKEIAAKKEFNLAEIAAGSIKTKDISIFCRQFYTMLKAGITIIKALDILQVQTENKKLRRIIGSVYTDVQKGSSLSEAMRKHSDFPELLINMVEAGELSGSLDSIMGRLADHFEKDNKLKNKVKSSMVYPVTLGILSIVIVIFILMFVMPTFIDLFASSNTPLPAPTKILISISNSLKNYWYIYALVIVLAVSGFRIALRQENVRLKWDAMKLKMPMVGKTLTMIVTARFTRTMSILLSSGMPLLQAMEVTSRVMSNKLAYTLVMGAREEIKKGMDLAGPVKRTGLFPVMVDSMIRIGEESGTLDEILERTAEFYDEEVDTATAKLTAALEPLMLIFMAGIIGFIVISMFLPMFDMMNTVTD